MSRPDINEAKIKHGTNKAIKFLKNVDLLRQSDPYNLEQLDYKKKYSNEFQDIVYTTNYFDVYKTAMERDDWDILLVDDSFFQFSFLRGNRGKEAEIHVKYAYYPNPREVLSYPDFIYKELNIEEKDVGDFFVEDYQQYLSEAPVKRFFTPFRYEYDIKSYKELSHATSHLHIGLEEDVRLAIDYMILPDMFVQMIVMLLYYETWKDKVVSDDKLCECCFNSKKRSQDVVTDILSIKEKQWFYIR